MGAADVVPGVSGGTIALVLGIYERLVNALSRFGLEFLGLLKRGKLSAAGRHVDARFLAALGTGIVGGLIVMSLLINRLMAFDFSRSLTFAAFFGMIIACGILVAMRIRPASATHFAALAALGIVGAAISAGLTLLNSTAGAAPSLWYLFFCGAIAICAMILPGISGAMMLLLLGVYSHLTDIPHAILHGEQVGLSLATVAVFLAGCVVGLTLFSRVLKWLLKHAHESTLAVLCGFMFGALPKLWPFQIDTTPEIEKFKHKVFVLDLQPAIDFRFACVVAVGVVAIAVIFAVQWLGKAGGQPASG